MKALDSMQVYVGTYAKYNNGSIEGDWLTITDYADKDAFIEACKELHKDESDPEFMFQDHQHIPDDFIHESGIEEELWQFIDLVRDWDEERLMAFELYLDNCGSYGDMISMIDKFDEDYLGYHDSEEEFAYDLACEMGYLDAMERAGLSRTYFDAEKFSNDLFTSDYWSATDRDFNLHVFRNR